MKILVIAEHDNTSLKGSTNSTIAAAKEIGSDITLLVAGQSCSEVANEGSNLDGVSEVMLVEDSIYENFLAEDLAKLVQSVADNFQYILAPATTFGKNFLPRVSALLDVQQISEITEVVSSDTFKRPIYAGSCIATVKSLEDKKVISVRSTAFDGVSAGSNNAPINNISPSESSNISSFVSEELAQSDRPELTAAEIVISGGRGMQSGDNFHLLDSIADKLGAAVGASRAAVDAGFVPNDYQVGQTGKIVAPDLYIAVGISGAIQHLAGMKDSKVIVAINKDEDAPIFQVADYGLVTDLFDALPELDSKL
ncbi:MAG: electron transfer flavoprotein subunit alpha/FixB family protein [SAR86 cluster bacterium]|jgi:electron transfer flavoprotein alpha subunit|uniref:Electron transfer flavoprotein subunit alpha n=1 Tax=SAR86 cluster bacterium TaxID=2030880 RepID=A0A520M8Y4_9GAMM|nr:MAG: electron transfer flavoprotein subunit alpha/FixB family protein [SAR86 cluster bacterium]|tara:strand:- start:3398 stop:4327 length:930 start_codon:yes stop_codon:yes gene_type:complete